MTASSLQTGNEPPHGNDSSSTTRWCASSGKFPQWWRVDLGAQHALTDFTVTWEQSDRTYSYEIETSSDDAVYAVQVKLSGAGAVQSAAFPLNLSARYVRVTVTAATPGVYGSATYPTWACFYDFSVNGQ